MEDIEKFMFEEINKRNNQPISDFVGYSPNEMHYILNDPFHSNSPIEMLKAKQEVYRNVPLFNQVKFLLDLIREKKELKLTNKGFLPTKIVAELYGKAYIKDYSIENGLSKLYKESNVQSIHLAKILVELSSFVKKRKNKLFLTKTGFQKIDN